MPNAIAMAKREIFANSSIFNVLDQICRAERVSFLDLRSIQLLDNEITVQFVRANGVMQLSTYPLTALQTVRENAADLFLEIK